MLNRLRDVFRFFRCHEVKYVVIGGIASILHGVPRATFDLDILIEATPDNAQRLIDALLDAGMGTAALTSPEDIVANEITIFNDRVRIDAMTSVPGIGFAEAWVNRVTMTYEGEEFFVVSKQDLIRSKRATRRQTDTEDANLLESSPKEDAQPGEPDGD